MKEFKKIIQNFCNFVNKFLEKILIIIACIQISVLYSELNNDIMATMWGIMACAWAVVVGFSISTNNLDGDDDNE